MDASNLFLSLFISTVGFGYFMYGRKQGAMSFVISGAIMMGYGYFIESFWLSLALGIVLSVAPFFIH